MTPPLSPAEDAMNRLLKRCVECAPGQPACPQCNDDEVCSIKPQSCDACASTSCIRLRALPGQQQTQQSSTPIGGIVGGVIGGVLVLSVITFAFWWFCIRGRRRPDTWDPAVEKANAAGNGARTRSRTNSIASTVLTRASNVIQIAYIPGVTVRSTTDTPDVPAVPSTYAGSTVASTPAVEQHFFMPSRDSTWSDASSMMSHNRVSLSPSLARASMATTIYPSDAVVPAIPAQYAFQAQANVVSVKSGASSPTTNRMSPTPPLPHTTTPQTMNGSQIVARSVSARPVEIKKSGSNNSNVPTLSSLAAAQQSRTRKVNVPSYSDEKEVVRSPALTQIEETPASSSLQPHSAYPVSADTASASGVSAMLPANSPLGVHSATAPSASTSNNSSSTTADISALILNAMKSATQDAAHSNTRPELHKHDSGPFSDSNEIDEHRGS